MFRSINILISAVGLAALVAAAPARAQDVSFGERIFQEKADCKFCHGPEGDGRGDPRSPGAAADLHKTILNKAQIVETVSCGRPGTEMPQPPARCRC